MTTPEQRTNLKAAAVVKPLEWKVISEVSQRATSIGLRYYVYFNSEDASWHSYTEGYQPEVFGQFGGQHEAKAVAQDDYERRVLSAIDISALEARVASAEGALRPFAEVAEWDIGDSEADGDKFRPIDGRLAVAEPLTVGNLRAARAHVQTYGGEHGRD